MEAAFFYVKFLEAIDMRDKLNITLGLLFGVCIEDVKIFFKGVKVNWENSGCYRWVVEGEQQNCKVRFVKQARFVDTITGRSKWEVCVSDSGVSISFVDANELAGMFSQKILSENQLYGLQPERFEGSACKMLGSDYLKILRKLNAQYS